MLISSSLTPPYPAIPGRLFANALRNTAGGICMLVALSGCFGDVPMQIAPKVVAHGSERGPSARRDESTPVAVDTAQPVAGESSPATDPTPADSESVPEEPARAEAPSSDPASNESTSGKADEDDQEESLPEDEDLVIEGPILSITKQPRSQRVKSGSSVTLAVAHDAEDRQEISYQWFLDGQALANANKDQLTIEPVLLAQAGKYHVRLRLHGQIFDSERAMLKVTKDDQAAIEWEAPAHREDGTRLGDGEIDTYRIYHMTPDAGEIAHEVAETRLTLRNLKPGRHEFMLTTVDSDGQESDFTPLLGKEIAY